ncbi:MAG TPA: exodeoxyribonuclease VII small subunit [Longimicrobiales bacterium]|nr:exodeoxyribonuclease VII small subunit [Longimicrobiales bacterium]
MKDTHSTGAGEGSSDGADEIGLDRRLDRLEHVVRELEREDQDLEQALRLFEEGVEHVRAARAALAKSELTIERLVSEAGMEDEDSGDPAGRGDR